MFVHETCLRQRYSCATEYNAFFTNLLRGTRKGNSLSDSDSRQRMHIDPNGVKCQTVRTFW